MFSSVKPNKILEFVTSQLEKELFSEDGSLKINIDYYKSIAKKKSGNKIPLRRDENGKILFSDWKLYELGYNGTLYKLTMAINDSSNQIFLTGFLDANSVFKFLITNYEGKKQEYYDSLSKVRNGDINLIELLREIEN